MTRVQSLPCSPSRQWSSHYAVREGVSARIRAEAAAGYLHLSKAACVGREGTP